MLLLEQFVTGTLGPHLAAVHNRDAVAEVLDVREEVRAEQHRLAPAGEGSDEILDLPGPDRVHAAGRLVEDEQLGIVDQALREADPPLHTLGVLADRPVLHRFEADHLQKHVDSLTAGLPLQSEQPAVVVECLPAA